MKNIILFEDNTLKSTEFLDKILQDDRYFDIRYIMIPLSEVNPLYMIHEPKKYMRTFKKAHIQFSCLVTRFSSIDEEYQTAYPTGEIMTLPMVDKDIATVSELLNYLHSINRINYCNKISHSNHDESICYEILEFAQFSIVVDTSDKKYRFSLKMDLTTERGKFGPREILKRLEKIYSPLSKAPRFFLGKKRWNSRCTPNVNLLVTIVLEESFSFLVIPIGDLNLITDMMYSAYCYNIIYSTKDVEMSEVEHAKISIDEGDHFRMSETIRYNSLWVRTVNQFLEYIAYLPFIYTNLLTMINPYNIYEITYDIDTKITLALYTQKFIELEAGVDNPITVAQILQLFYQINDQ